MRVAKPTYKFSKTVTSDEETEEHLVALNMLRAKIILRKPVYTGFFVLDLSKPLMYQFHYKHVLPKYGVNKAKMLFTDTDSLTYHIQTEDIYQDMKADQDLFDTSGYPVEHFLHSATNKRKIGKFKDENDGASVSEFVGLRSKMYSMISSKDEGEVKGKKTAKGVKKSVLAKEIHHQDYRDSLFNKAPQQHEMSQFQRNNHEMFTVKLTKTSLSPYDDKRFMLDGCTTRAHGHYRNTWKF